MRGLMSVVFAEISIQAWKGHLTIRRVGGMGLIPSSMG